LRVEFDETADSIAAVLENQMYKEAVIENIGMERYEEVMLELKELRKEEEKY
jgi:hypothetical protein